MDKITSHFWKYSLALLLVAVILIIIGAISLSRTSKHQDNRVFSTLNAKENIALLSDENVKLTERGNELESELDQKDQKINELTQKEAAVEQFSEIQILMSEKRYDEAKEKIPSLDPQLLPEGLRQALVEFQELIEKEERTR